MPIHFLPYGTPLLLIAAAAISAFGPQHRPSSRLKGVEALAFLAFAVAVLSTAVLVVMGPGTGALQTPGGLGISVRVDVVSMSLLMLVAFIGWIVVRFSRVYLDGEARQGAFMAWLCTTLAMVTLLVSAGDLIQLVLALVIRFVDAVLVFVPEVLRIIVERFAGVRPAEC